jgi:hypothetical protein
MQLLVRFGRSRFGATAVVDLAFTDLMPDEVVKKLFRAMTSYSDPVKTCGAEWA